MTLLLCRALRSQWCRRSAALSTDHTNRAHGAGGPVEGRRLRAPQRVVRAVGAARAAMVARPATRAGRHQLLSGSGGSSDALTAAVGLNAAIRHRTSDDFDADADADADAATSLDVLDVSSATALAVPHAHAHPGSSSSSHRQRRRWVHVSHAPHHGHWPAPAAHALTVTVQCQVRQHQQRTWLSTAAGGAGAGAGAGASSGAAGSSVVSGGGGAPSTVAQQEAAAQAAALVGAAEGQKVLLSHKNYSYQTAPPKPGTPAAPLAHTASALSHRVEGVRLPLTPNTASLLAQAPGAIGAAGAAAVAAAGAPGAPGAAGAGPKVIPVVKRVDARQLQMILSQFTNSPSQASLQASIRSTRAQMEANAKRDAAAQQSAAQAEARRQEMAFKAAKLRAAPQPPTPAAGATGPAALNSLHHLNNLPRFMTAGVTGAAAAASHVPPPPPLPIFGQPQQQQPPLPTGGAAMRGGYQDMWSSVIGASRPAAKPHQPPPNSQASADLQNTLSRFLSAPGAAAGKPSLAAPPGSAAATTGAIASATSGNAQLRLGTHTLPLWAASFPVTLPANADPSLWGLTPRPTGSLFGTGSAAPPPSAAGAAASPAAAVDPANMTPGERFAHVLAQVIRFNESKALEVIKGLAAKAQPPSSTAAAAATPSGGAVPGAATTPAVAADAAAAAAAAAASPTVHVSSTALPEAKSLGTQSVAVSSQVTGGIDSDGNPITTTTTTTVELTSRVKLNALDKHGVVQHSFDMSSDALNVWADYWSANMAPTEFSKAIDMLKKSKAMQEHFLKSAVINKLGAGGVMGGAGMGAHHHHPAAARGGGGGGGHSALNARMAGLGGLVGVGGPRTPVVPNAAGQKDFRPQLRQVLADIAAPILRQQPAAATGGAGVGDGVGGLLSPAQLAQRRTREAKDRILYNEFDDDDRALLVAGDGGAREDAELENVETDAEAKAREEREEREMEERLAREEAEEKARAALEAARAKSDEERAARLEVRRQQARAKYEAEAAAAAAAAKAAGKATAPADSLPSLETAEQRAAQLAHDIASGFQAELLQPVTTATKMAEAAALASAAAAAGVTVPATDAAATATVAAATAAASAQIATLAAGRLQAVDALWARFVYDYTALLENERALKQDDDTDAELAQLAARLGKRATVRQLSKELGFPARDLLKELRHSVRRAARDDADANANADADADEDGEGKTNDPAAKLDIESVLSEDQAKSLIEHVFAQRQLESERSDARSARRRALRDLDARMRSTLDACWTEFAALKMNTGFDTQLQSLWKTARDRATNSDEPELQHRALDRFADRFDRQQRAAPAAAAAGGRKGPSLLSRGPRFDKAALAAAKAKAAAEEAEAAITPEERAIAASIRPRAPVVCVMGHVDHGKTTLLDRLRQTDVAAHEEGGITQSIGAFSVRMHDASGDGKSAAGAGAGAADPLSSITFLDTPGHAAFRNMRSRGAYATDIVVLVVAADDGVMPQTLEALQLAQRSNLPMVVAINKCDIDGVDPENVRQQLRAHGVAFDTDAGGETPSVEISARTGMGFDELKQTIRDVAEYAELKAPTAGPAMCYVIESKQDKKYGVVVDAVVGRGTLNVGDIVVCGTAQGRVKLLLASDGSRVKSVGPAQPVRIVAFESVDRLGVDVTVVPDDRAAVMLVQQRTQDQYNANQDDEQQRVDAAGPVVKTVGPKTARRAAWKLRFETERRLRVAYEMPKYVDTKSASTVAIVLKADVAGSLEAMLEYCRALPTDEVQVSVVRTGLGPIHEADVDFAAEVKAMGVFGFNVDRPSSAIALAAAQRGVHTIHTTRIIYGFMDSLRALLSSRLPPVETIEVLGSADVLQVFPRKTGKRLSVVAGCRMRSGELTRKKRFRIVRDGEVVWSGDAEALRIKDEKKETIPKGTECGVLLDRSDLPADAVADDYVRVGDVIECFATTITHRQLDDSAARGSGLDSGAADYSAVRLAPAPAGARSAAGARS